MRPHTLRRYGTPLLGRGPTIDRIDAALDAGERLITLVGPPGVGKTRLAVAYSERWLADASRDRRGGVVSVSLAHARTSEDLDRGVAQALGAQPGDATEEQERPLWVGRLLATRGSCIVLLDNVEQLISIAEARLSAWIGGAPEAVFIVTSRQPLYVGGEVVVPVPLMESADAVQHFVTSAGPDNAVRLQSAEAQRWMGEIVEQLAGIPLAVELAAARLEVLSLRELHTRLSSRFDLLRDPSRRTGERHGTLYNAIDWSWKLLTDWEQQALLQSACFVGAFTVQAAEAVIELPPHRAHRSVLDALQSLQRKSLLRRRTPGEGLPTRFELGRNVREYALDHLEKMAETEALRDRHATYFLGLVGSKEARSPARADQAHGVLCDNLRVIFQRALERSRAITTPDIRLLPAALALSHAVEGWISAAEQSTRWDEVFHIVEPCTELHTSDDFIEALFARGDVFRRLGAVEKGLSVHRRAAEIAQGRQDQTLEARAQRHLGVTHWYRGALPAARSCLDRARTLSEQLGDPMLMGEVFQSLARLEQGHGRYAEAIEFGGCAVEQFRLHGDTEKVGSASAELAFSFLQVGELEQAAPALEIATAMVKDLREAALVQGYRGIRAHLQGDLDLAYASFQAGVDTFKRLSEFRLEGEHRLYLGLVALENGDLEQARAFLEQARGCLENSGDVRGIGMALSVESLVAVLSENHVAAARDLERSDAVLASIDAPHLRATLGVGRCLLNLQQAREHDDSEMFVRALADAGEALNRLGDTTQSNSSYVLRLMVRVARDACSRLVARRDAWRVSADGLTFQPAGQSEVAVESLAPARILLALTQQRIELPGVPLTTETLVEAGWPDTKLVERAGANRLYVAISSLRKLGLDCVQRKYGVGYLIDAEVDMYIDDTATPSGAVA